MSASARTTPDSDHRSRPRKKRIPSARDQAILIAFRTTGRTQADLAQEYKLSQSRIAQIIRRVDAWRSQAQPADSGQSQAERRRLERSMHEQQLQAIYDRGLRGYDQAPKELTTVREGERDGKHFKEETRRQQPANVQLLKAALGASRELGRLDGKSSAEEETAPQDPQQKRDLAVEVLRELRFEAQQAGLVPSRGDTLAFVRDLVKSLVGEPNCGFWRFLQDEAEEKEMSVGCVEAAAADGTPDPFSNASNVTNPAADESAQDFAAQGFENPMDVHKSEQATAHIASPPRTDYSAPSTPPSLSGAARGQATTRSTLPSSKSSPAADDALERRLEHFRKIAEHEEYVRQGQPHTLILDPADGPIPPVVYHLDDPGWKPSPPPSREEEAQRMKDHLAQVQANNEANLRRLSAPD